MQKPKNATNNVWLSAIVLLLVTSLMHQPASYAKTIAEMEAEALQKEEQEAAKEAKAERDRRKAQDKQDAAAKAAAEQRRAQAAAAQKEAQEAKAAQDRLAAQAAEAKRKQDAAAKTAAKQRRAEAAAQAKAEQQKKNQAEADRLRTLEAERLAAEAEERQREAEKVSAIALTNLLEPDMVAITGGCFQMGSPASEKDRENDEKQHQACVADFYLGKHEVSKGQFAAFVSATGYRTEAEAGDGCHFWTGTEWKKDKQRHWRNLGFAQNDDHPVACVSWNDAQAYIAWLNQQTHKNYRLPTEAEWEYAARAGTATPFYTGACISTQQANYHGHYDYNSCGAKTGLYLGGTSAVGGYPANPWGLYDMAGNVWEWTCSAYVADYDGSESKCISNNDAKTLRVLRGGSWDSGPRWLRSANRDGYTAGIRFNDVGFRLSRM
ncbi:hypothetical protein JCM14076_26650 [Methylosoma difficile]